MSFQIYTFNGTFHIRRRIFFSIGESKWSIFFSNNGSESETANMSGGANKMLATNNLTKYGDMQSFGRYFCFFFYVLDCHRTTQSILHVEIN